MNECERVMVTVMRNNLKQYHTSYYQQTYSGIFVRYGWSKDDEGNTISTILLREIRDSNGKILTDHVWLIKPHGFNKHNIHTGDTIMFKARVGTYTKNYINAIDDFNFTHITNIRKVSSYIANLSDKYIWDTFAAS